MVRSGFSTRCKNRGYPDFEQMVQLYNFVPGSCNSAENGKSFHDTKKFPMCNFTAEMQIPAILLKGFHYTGFHDTGGVGKSLCILSVFFIFIFILLARKYLSFLLKLRKSPAGQKIHDIL